MTVPEMGHSTMIDKGGEKGNWKYFDLQPKRNIKHTKKLCESSGKAAKGKCSAGEWL